VIPLLLAVGGTILFSSAPASAASSTDSVYVNDYPTNLVEPLPAGIPDVVTPLVNAVTDICQLPLPTYDVPELTLGQVFVCYSPYDIPVNETIVAGTPNVGVVQPDGFGPPPGCGLALYDFPVKGGDTADVGLAPPGADC
jgi:hypothetical protein